MPEVELDFQSDAVRGRARISFDSIVGSGIVQPFLDIKLQVRVTSPEGGVVQPHGLKAECLVSDVLIAVGEGKEPLRKWDSYYEQRFVLRFPLMDKAIKHIEAQLSNDYIPLEIKIVGTCHWAKPTGPERWGAFSEASLKVPELTRIDWSNKVLRPIGWRQWFFLSYPAPKFSEKPGDDNLFKLLDELDQQFLTSPDRGVFQAAYDVLDPFYSRRESIRARLGDSAKAGGIEALIEQVRRFANGGRHRPEPDRDQGGFTQVDQRDAELVRGLTLHLVAYLTKFESA